MRWTAERVAVFVVDEWRTIKQRAFALVVDGAISRHVWPDGLLFAARGLLSVRIPRVGNDVECSWIVQRLFRGFRHRQRTAIVVRLGGHLLRHDDAVFSIHRGLHVVSR